MDGCPFHTLLFLSGVREREKEREKDICHYFKNNKNNNICHYLKMKKNKNKKDKIKYIMKVAVRIHSHARMTLSP